MKRSLALRALAAVAAILIGTEAWALKTRVEVGAGNLKAEGFLVTAAEGDGGSIDVTVTRDLSKARAPAAGSDVVLVRHATLEVLGPGPTRVACDVEPRVAGGAVAYRFRLSPANLAHARLTVSEDDDYKPGLNREHLIGGGTHFELKLADVVKVP